MTDGGGEARKGNVFFSAAGWIVGVVFVLIMVSALLVFSSGADASVFGVVLGLGFGLSAIFMLPPTLAYLRARIGILNGRLAPSFAALAGLVASTVIAGTIDPQATSQASAQESNKSTAHETVKPATSAQRVPSEGDKSGAEPSAPTGGAGSSRVQDVEKASPAKSEGLTNVQRNAVRSAERYLRMTGFSKQGLIQQLSSEYGDQFSVADAAAAVNSMEVDWNENAARSAARYLQMSGFSCQGLIDQLSSEYGDNYTRSQAEYGARQAGAC